MNKENKRVILKTISWRTIATSMSMLLVYLVSGQLALTAGVGIFEVLVRTSFYFLHEKMWHRISLK